MSRLFEEAKRFIPGGVNSPVRAFRAVGGDPPFIASGAGARIRDADGKEYIDLTSGWGVTAIGHCHPALVEAISEQVGTLMQTTNLFYTLPQLDLIERMAEDEA